MKLPLALLATAAAMAAAAGGGGASAPSRRWWPNLRRRAVTYQKIAGYIPSSQVTDHCAIDRDQAAMEAQLALGTAEGFANARQIYELGGNSETYARIQILWPGGLVKDLEKGSLVLGEGVGGGRVVGRAYEDYEKGEKLIEVQYETGGDGAMFAGCHVGGLVEIDTTGCFKGDGQLEIHGALYPYHYHLTENNKVESDNRNGRSIAGFSEGIEARDIIHSKEDFKYFYEYYGTDDYAHRFIEAAFTGKSTQFTKDTAGNADFSRYDFVGREHFIKRATGCMSIFMSIIREWEEALDDCERGCVDCGEGSTHPWDEGVCFYTGSLEGTDGSAEGHLLHQLADDLCPGSKTCGVVGRNETGTAKLNYDLFGLFSLGKFQILNGNCPAARKATREIVAKMYTLLIQGAVQRAHEVDRREGGEEERAEGAAFAAAVLPRIHAASPEAARVIYDNLKVGASSTDSIAVKEAFESVYEDIGILCNSVGGIWNDDRGEYYAGMEPCIEIADEPKDDPRLAIILGSTFGALFVASTAMVIYMRRREKMGRPVFNPLAPRQPNEQISADILALYQSQRKRAADTLSTTSDHHPEVPIVSGTPDTIGTSKLPK